MVPRTHQMAVGEGGDNLPEEPLDLTQWDAAGVDVLIKLSSTGVLHHNHNLLLALKYYRN